jgi:hypothetical protein
MRAIRIVVLGIVLCASAATADADVILHENLPNGQSIYFADLDYEFIETTANELTFSLAPGASTITGVHWWGGCVGGAVTGPQAPATDPNALVPDTCPAPGSFELRFYEDDGTPPNPGTAEESRVVTPTQNLTGNSISGYITEYRYEADLSLNPVVLNPNIGYFFSVRADFPVGVTWGLETFGAEDRHFQLANPPGAPAGWGFQNDALAFRLLGPDDPNPQPIPEPATMTLLGTGVALTLARRRRKSRR